MNEASGSLYKVFSCYVRMKKVTVCSYSWKVLPLAVEPKGNTTFPLVVANTISCFDCYAEEKWQHVLRLEALLSPAGSGRKRWLQSLEEKKSH